MQLYEPVSDASVGALTILFWADPLGHARDDYDLYDLDADGNVVAASQDVQTGTQDPIEGLFLPEATGSRLAVVRFAGEPRYLQLTAFGGRFADAGGLKAFVTPGATRGHSAAVNAFSVAAAPAATPFPLDLEPGDPANPSGPFPQAFTSAQKPERFTSDGPRQMFFDADGRPHRQLRRKPDITAADGVSTSLGAFTPFFGTSAAAPHAAAIAALVVSGNRGATTAFIRRAFNHTSVDLAPAGIDARTGRGLIRADRLLAFTGADPQPLISSGAARVTPTTGDGDAYLEPGETGTLALPLTDVGDGTATNVALRVTSADPKVTITPRTVAYGTIARGATATRNFAIALAADYPLGRSVPLALHVTFGGALSPVDSSVSIGTGQPAATARTFGYQGAPVPIPDDSPVGASVPIPVSGVGYAARLTFSIDGSACSDAPGATTVGIDHTFVSDLVGTLTSPAGRTAQLFAHIGATGVNLCRVVFDDRAATPLSDAMADQAPFTGTWLPVNPLSGLLSTSVDGTWKFTAVDSSADDVGSIRAVSLHITGFRPS